jgi:hypothetical protein
MRDSCLIGRIGQSSPKGAQESNGEADIQEREIRFRPAERPSPPEPAAVTKHGRPVAVVMAIEEFERTQGARYAATCAKIGGNKESKNRNGPQEI